MSDGRGRVVTLAFGSAIGVLVAASFFAATTFVGDDHLFLTFARLAPNPWAAFVTDQHGGEYYRPVPMALWWLLARVGGGATWPFALMAAGLHATVSLEIVALLLALREERAVAVTAGIIFFVAPQTLEAAYWFSASTDLLATAATLGSLAILVRGGSRWSSVVVSTLLAAIAYASKESALILPLLAFLLVRVPGAPHASLGSKWPRVIPHAVLAGVYVVIRWHILKGWGGSAEARASLSGKALQLLSGLVHIVPGQGALPEPVAWGLGCVFLLVLVREAYLGRRRGQHAAVLPLACVAIAVLPLMGAEWAVGARYFYLPSVGVSWLGARVLLRWPFAARAVVLGLMITCIFLQFSQRRREVKALDERVAVSRRVVVNGLAHGHTIFHIGSGVKDLDLAVKEDPAIAQDPRATGLLVITDVPASFVLMPPSLAQAGAFMVAAPPIPPSGAYRFGGQRVVGLARRGDDPLLGEVVERLPDIQFIALRLAGTGQIVARNITQEVKGETTPP